MKRYTNYAFELPYNFDREIINEYSYLFERSDVRCVYVSPMYEDHFSAKKSCVLNNVDSCRDISNISEGVYKEHIYGILNKFNAAVLFQHPILEVSEDIIKRYVSYGFTQFLVSQDKLALRIKMKYGDSINTIASIIRKTSMHDILHTDMSMYDDIVLFNPLNVNLDSFDTLPNDRNFTCLVNTACEYRCECHHHWFANIDDDIMYISECLKSRIKGDYIDSSVEPWNLPALVDKINTFKIGGRENTTEQVLAILFPYYTHFLELRYRNSGYNNLIKEARSKFNRLYSEYQNPKIPTLSRYGDFFEKQS